MWRGLAELERQKLLSHRSLLSSDHGFFLGEHHFYDKRVMYEPSIRVPMIVSCPGHVKAGTKSDEMVLNSTLRQRCSKSRDSAARGDAGQEHAAAR